MVARFQNVERSPSADKISYGLLLLGDRSADKTDLSRRT